MSGFRNLNIGERVLNNLQSTTAMSDEDEAPWLLAIDTSTEQIGIALTDGERMVELSVPGGRAQTQGLLSAIDWLLQRRGMSTNMIGATAVAIGPGSFTGLRVGLSVAKGLAIAQSSAAIGVPTLDIAAWPYRVARTSLLAVLPAGRSRFVWSIYDENGNGTDPRNGTVDELLQALVGRPDLLVVGEFSIDAYQTIAVRHERVESRLLGTRRAAALADVGYRRWQAGDINDSASLEPIYLHGKQTANPPRSQR